MDNWFPILAVAALAAALWITITVLKRRHRKQELLAKYTKLMSKYNDQQVVRAIMEEKVWQGMSQEQLIDSRGLPDDRDQVVYKTKIKETWKYGRTGRNRFAERIFIENGTIVGWKG
jgi:hypothetical protein